MNSLWSLSLVISLVGALLATSLQQWARQYIGNTQPKQCSPEKHARRRAFFAGGVDRMHFRRAVEALPLLIHLSLFLFFSGLIIFMRNINHSVYLAIVLAVGLFSAVYVSFTFMPMFWPDSPYNTPLSLIAHEITLFVVYSLIGCYSIAMCIVIIILSILEVLILGCLIALLPFYFIIALFIWLVCGATVFRSVFTSTLPSLDQITLTGKRWSIRASIYVFRPPISFLDWVSGYSRNAAGKRISQISSEIDLGILQWTIGALGDDDTLVKYFESIPGFFHSQRVRDLKRPLPDMFVTWFSNSWGGFLARNLLSNSIDNIAKTHRVDICMKAIKEICADNGPTKIFCRLSNLRFDQGPLSIHTAKILESWCASNDTNTSELARYTIAKMLPYIRERDDNWIELARDIFGLQENTLRDHIARGDNSVLLFILIRAARQVMSEEPWKWEMLTSISKFDIIETSRELRNEFCSLWNEIVQEARLREDHHDNCHLYILHGIRHLYIPLHHQGTNSAPASFDASTPDDDLILYYLDSYPSCTDSVHRPNSTFPLLPQLEGPNDPSPSLSERQPTPGGRTIPHQTNDSNVIAGRPSPENPSSSPLLSRESSSPDPNTVSEHIVLQANTATSSSTREPTQTVTLDVSRLAVAEVSHFSHQSSLPTVALTADVVHPHHPTTDAPINEMGQASQTSTVTVQKLPRSEAIPAIITPLAVPSASGDFFDAFF